MKRIVKVVIACAFIVGVASMGFASGSKDSKAKDSVVELSVLAYGDNASAEGTSFVRIVEEFEAANPNIKVNSELLFDQAYHQKVTARLASGDVPDVAYMGSDARWGAPWDEAGQHTDMKASIVESGLYDLDKIGADTADGKYFYVPLGSANWCTPMFVNTELLAKYGADVPTTYEDLKALVAVAKADGVEVLSIHGADAWAWGSCLFSTIVAQTNGDNNWIQDADDGKNKFTDPEFVNAYKFLKTMVDDGVLSADSILIDGGTGTSNFSNGKYICYMDGQWGAGSFSQERQNNMVMMPFVAIPGAKGNTNTLAAAKTVGYGYTQSCVDAGHVDAAMKFINYYNSAVEVEQRLRDGALTGTVLKDFVMPDDMPVVMKLKDSLSGYAITPVIDSIITGAANDAILTGCQQVVIGDLTPMEAAEAVEAKMDR